MSALYGSTPPPPPAAGSSRFPDFFLLNKEASISDLRNETTAAALTRAGLTVQVSFAVADPPRLSTCCIYCPNRGESQFAYTPEIICSAEDTALIRVALTTEQSPQHFLYRAHNGGPSLQLLPDIREYASAEHLLEPPLGFFYHDKQFVMAALSFGTLGALGGTGQDGEYYNLHTIACSEPHSTWSKKLLKVEYPNGHTAKKSEVINLTNVIALGGGLLGWVDLWKGILICDVLNPAATTAYFVPMPMLLPSNNELYGNWYSARPIRDVTFTRGYIKCVEFEQLMKLRPTIVHPVPDAWHMEELHDSELAICPSQEEEEVYDVVGWRLITWYRALNSDGWRRGNMVHSDDLIETVSLPQPGGGALNVPFKNLETWSPTLRGDDDAVYLVSKLHEYGEAAWIVPVDTKRKSVGEVMLSPAEVSSISDLPFIPCVLTKYLDAKSDGDQAGKRNTSHVPPSPNINKSKKQRQQLSQAGLEEQQPESQLLQHS